MTINLISASALTTTTASSFTTTLPTGIQTGDMVLVMMCCLDSEVNSFNSAKVARTSPTTYFPEYGDSVLIMNNYYMLNPAPADSGTTLSWGLDVYGANPIKTSIVTLHFRSSLGRGLRIAGSQGYVHYATHDSAFSFAFENTTACSILAVAAIAQLPAVAGAVAPPAITASTAAPISWTRWFTTATADMSMWGYYSNEFASGSTIPYQWFLGTNTVVGTMSIAQETTYIAEQQFSLTTSEPIRLSRTVTPNLKTGIAAADIFAARDSTDPTRSVVAAAADGVGVADTAVRALGATLREFLPLADVPGPITSYRVVMAELTRLQDSMARGFPALLTDQVRLSRAATAMAAVTVIERLGLAAVVDAAMKLALTVTERAALTDELRRFFSGVVSEGIGVLSTSVETKRAVDTVVETLGLNETLTPRMVFRLTAADTVTLDDIDLLKMLYTGQLAEAIEISALYVQPGGNITTWAINTRSGATTEYTGYDFNSFTQSGLRYLGASSSGLYALEGDTDEGLDIVAAIKSGYMQINGSRFAGLKAVYLGLRGGGEYFLKLEAGSGETYTYRVLAEDMATTKIWTGKGLRHRYLSFELITAGQDFDLDTIEFVPTQVVRRV